MSERDAGTVIPLVLLSLLLAGLVGTAGTAASAAFLAQRDLAGVCDGAALAAAAAVDRGGIDDETLPLDPSAVRAAADRYRRRAGRPGLALRARTDGRTVTVECRRTVRIPFGAVLGQAGGLERAAVARARPAVLPAAHPPSTCARHSGQFRPGCWRGREDRGTVAGWPPPSTPPLPRSSACCTRAR